MIDTLKRKLRTASRQDFIFFVWLLPAWCLLGFSRLVILTTSFKRIARVLGVHDGLEPRTPLCTPQQEARADSIGRAIRVAAKYTPWTSNCFPQAITGRLILGVYNIPYAIFFGVRREENSNKLKAHAWVVSGRVNITGGRSFRDFTSVGCFISYGK